MFGFAVAKIFTISASFRRCPLVCLRRVDVPLLSSAMRRLRPIQRGPHGKWGPSIQTDFLVVTLALLEEAAGVTDFD